MTVSELLKIIEFERLFYKDDKIELAVWNDEINDYLDFHFRKAKSVKEDEKLFMYIHPIITDKNFHYY